MVASCVPPTGDLACNPGICPKLGIEPASLWFAGGTQSTEPHQLGLQGNFLIPRLNMISYGSMHIERNTANIYAHMQTKTDNTHIRQQ